MTKKFSYNKTEKLKSRKQLNELFIAGKQISSFPIKLFFKEENNNVLINIKTGVGVSSKHFKKATERNRIKRLLREFYRLNKQPVYDYCFANKKQLILFFLFVGKDLPDYIIVLEKIKIVIEKLIEKLNRDNSLNEESLTNT